MRKDELETLPTSFRYVAALVSAMLVSSLPLPVLSQTVELMVVDVHSVAEGYRASKLIGSSVVNDQNEKVGTIEDIIIGRDMALARAESGHRLGRLRRLSICASWPRVCQRALYRGTLVERLLNKSTARPFIAATAVDVSPWPVITITGRSKIPGDFFDLHGF